MEDFDIASTLARAYAEQMIAAELPAEQIAEAFIVEGLALWGAHAGRKADAESLLRIFDYERSPGLFSSLN